MRRHTLERAAMILLIVACLAIPGYVEARTEPQKAVMVETPTPAPSEAVQPDQEPEETPEPLHNPTPLTDAEYIILLECCETYDIAPSLVLGLIYVESRFDPDAVSPKGCRGYMQLNPTYFPGDLTPEENIRTGVEYLAYQLNRYGNVESGLTAYNAGHDTGGSTYARLVLTAAEEWEEKING